MIKYVSFLFLILPISLSYADDLPIHNVHIGWTYDECDSDEGDCIVDSDEYEMRGFRLYKEGIPVCSTSERLAREMDCIIYSEPGEFGFTLTALWTENDGDFESHHSPIYQYNVEGYLLPVPIVQIKFTLE